jgi:hypothetical protein
MITSSPISPNSSSAVPIAPRQVMWYSNSSKPSPCHSTSARK